MLVLYCMKFAKSKLWGIFIVLIASIVIFLKFTQIPAHFAFDEVEFARLALSLKDSPYSVYSTLATGHSTLYFYVILASFYLFKVSSFALRLPSAIFGVLSALVFYKLMVGLFINKKIELKFKKAMLTVPLAFLLTLILVSSRWFFSFARFAFEPTFLLFLELSSLYFVFKFVSSEKWRHLGISAIFAGLAYHSYTPGRIFFIIPMLTVILLTKNKFKNISSYLIILFMVMLPLIVYLWQHQDIRIREQMYISNTELTIEDKIAFFEANTLNNIKMLYVPGQGDGNGRHNYPLKPAINPILFALFVLGSAVALSKPRNKTHAIFWIYLGISFAPTLLTYPWENPNMLRTYTMIPGLVYFIGVGLSRSIEVINARFNKPLWRSIVVAGLLLIVCASSLYELRTYFYYQARDVIPHAFDEELNLKNLH